jgi:RNA polymerase-binding transcription factor DksA
MTAPAEVSRGARRVATPQVSTVQANAVRARLVARRREQTAQFAGHQATLVALTADSSATGLDRALAALRMYGACEAIEEIEKDLVRLDNSGHGSCRSCGRPIPFEHLETIPQAGFCVACLSPVRSSADGLTAPRRRPVRGEHTGALPPPPLVCSPQHLQQLASSTSDDIVGDPRSREMIGCDEDDIVEQIDRGRAPGIPPPVASHPLALAESRARHPSSARHDEEQHESTCPACGSTSTTPADAAEAVRRLVALARRLLRGNSDEARRHLSGRPTTLDWSPWERTARLRDELHVTANRVARFGVDDQPIVDPIRITAPTAAGAGLGPEQLLFQLDLSAGRLVALLGPLSEWDWTRTCQLGDRLVTLGELVDRVLHGAVHDLLDLLQTAPVPGSERPHVLTDGRSLRDRDEHPSRYSPEREADRHVRTS